MRFGMRRLSTPLYTLAIAVLVGSLPGIAQTTGLVPLNDLGPAFYQGYQGGLYPGGSNAPPSTHEAAAIQAASQIVPRGLSGTPDPQGLIGMIAVGMSNTTHEFGAFERDQDANPRRNARVVIVDTAFGGQTAATIANPNAAYWTTMQQRLTAMSLSAAQVQVAWLKEADAQPPNDFPGHALALQSELVQIVNNLHTKFPNLKICYLSSRIYGGYAPQGSLNPEPQAYESGFSVKWLIEDQINGDPTLNYGQLPGPIRSPLLLWGPYLWADGTNPRSDGLTWIVTDLENDHTHPSPSGEQKVSMLLSSFFSNEATAESWWTEKDDAGLVAIDTVKDAHVSAASPSANFGASTTLIAQGTANPFNIYLGFDVGALPRPVSLAKLSLRVDQGGGGRVSLVSSTSWSEGALTYNNAPAIGATVKDMPPSSRDGTVGANVTAAVNADVDGVLSFALTTTSAGQATYHSKEAAQPPRLVAIVSCAASPDSDGDGRGDPCDCEPADPTIVAAPREVLHLRWSDSTTMIWDSIAPQSGIGTRYDVASGDLADVANLSANAEDLCLGNDLANTQITDESPRPLAGSGRFYLVRGVNSCGRSRFETASDGRDRAMTVCP